MDNDDTKAWGPEEDRDPENPSEFSEDFDWSNWDFDDDPDWQ